MAWDRGVSASRRGRGRRGQVAEGGRCLYVEGNLVDVLVHQDRTAATSDENMVDESGFGVEVDREMHVASVIHPVDDIWDWESMRNLISEEDCMEVSNIQVDDS
ncbi:hypothetical protein ACFX2I_033120 [Malus domestica]